MSKHDDSKKVVESDSIEEVNEAATPDVAFDSERENLKQQIEEAENKYKRALADYQNLQKRSIDERQEWIRSANRDLLLRILTVLDTLVLAYQHVQDKNLEVSINYFLNILKSEGVIRIETVGKDFDPAEMEAIATVEGKEGKVVAEARAGFMINDTLLRAAQVTVGQKG